jgi:hypothetical protein
MLMTILMLLLIVVVIGSFMFCLSYFAVGTVKAIADKRRGEQFPPGVGRGVETSEQKEAREKREARRLYLTSLVDRVETPEEKAALEKKEARKRYLGSLVDR